MANITITIPDNEISRAINAICSKYNYQDTIIVDIDKGPIPNPETKAQFAKRMVARIIKEAVLEQEKQDAVNAIAIADIDVN